VVVEYRIGNWSEERNCAYIRSGVGPGPDPRFFGHDVANVGCQFEDLGLVAHIAYWSSGGLHLGSPWDSFSEQLFTMLGLTLIVKKR
jgi:hypothetical protein